MRLTLIISTILGAALALSVCGLILVREMSKLLPSPSWDRKRLAWWLLIGCELVSLADRIYTGAQGRWTGLIYSTLFALAVAGMVDSYRLMLKDLQLLLGRLDKAD